MLLVFPLTMHLLLIHTCLLILLPLLFLVGPCPHIPRRGMVLFVNPTTRRITHLRLSRAGDAVRMPCRRLGMLLEVDA